jgi:hypothetical protein
MCFTLGFLEQLLVWLVIVCAIVAILRLLLPWVAGQLGAAGGIVLAVINIVLWAVVAIYVIYFCFMLIECLAGSGGGLLLPHR